MTAVVGTSRLTKGTVARMAGNILSGLVGPYVDQNHDRIEDEAELVAFAVRLARKTLAEIDRTEPDTND